ncbi:MAG TPA: D-2-hydroxyacid dehydrogenase [Dehalococcoidia bacterium]|jgi:phosphoglycerate dehydrogenase-like enzyme
MAETIRVTIALPLANEMIEAIRAVSDRLQVTALSRSERYVYRDGRPLWAGYAEPAVDETTLDGARETLEPILRETEILLSNPIVPDNILERAAHLRWVQLTSAGADRLVDSELVLSGRVKVTTASGIHAIPISEYVIGVMIAFAKGFPRAFRSQANNAWQAYLAAELDGATVGVLGLGAIGGRVAELSKALGMRVLAVRRSCQLRMSGAEAGEPFADQLFPPSELPAFLAECDFVVLAVPLTAESRHMIGDAELEAMKPTAVIVNIARGAVIDQAALVRALKAGRIGGAALDVTEPEPLPPDSELWGLENVMITPHISGGTPRYMDRAIELFCDNLRRYLAGEPLRNVVDPSRGY